MSDHRKDEFRTVNALLGAKPMLGPLAAEQIVPWTIILGLSTFAKQIFNLDWRWAGMLAVWGIATWWILTGSHPLRFLSKFQRVPTWGRGYVNYRSLRLIEAERTSRTRKHRKS